MNAEARRSMRIAELTRYFLSVYEKTGGASDNKARRAYKETLIRAKKTVSPQTADEYLDEIIERLRKK
jgi:hypothetical protein